MKKQCQAVLITDDGSTSKNRAKGGQCPDHAIEESDFCWTHDRSIKRGVRTEDDVRGLSR